MQADEASTPLRQLYFIVQTMLMDPANAGMTAELYKHLSFRTRQAITNDVLQNQIDVADRKVNEGRYFDALKILRNSFASEQVPGQSDRQGAEVAA